MPIYEYKCENCGDDFECIVFRTDEAVECPKCGSAESEEEDVFLRVLHGTQVQVFRKQRFRLLRVLILELLFLLLISAEWMSRGPYGGSSGKRV